MLFFTSSVDALKILLCVCGKGGGGGGEWGLRRNVNINGHNTTLHVVNFLVTNSAKRSPFLVDLPDITAKSSSIFFSFFQPFPSPVILHPSQSWDAFPSHKNPRQGCRRHVSSAKRRYYTSELWPETEEATSANQDVSDCLLKQFKPLR